MNKKQYSVIDTLQLDFSDVETWFRYYKIKLNEKLKKHSLINEQDNYIQ